MANHLKKNEGTILEDDEVSSISCLKPNLMQVSEYSHQPKISQLHTKRFSQHNLDKVKMKPTKVSPKIKVSPMEQASSRNGQQDLIN